MHCKRLNARPYPVTFPDVPFLLHFCIGFWYEWAKWHPMLSNNHYIVYIRTVRIYLYTCICIVTISFYSLGSPFYSINKTDRHDITDILLKVALNTINQTILPPCYLLLARWILFSYKRYFRFIQTVLVID